MSLFPWYAITAIVRNGKSHQIDVKNLVICDNLETISTHLSWVPLHTLNLPKSTEAPFWLCITIEWIIYIEMKLNS